MTARQPRRARRRAAPTSLPRPSATPIEENISPAASATATAPRAAARRTPVHHREHHVTRDYGHVHKDLVTVSIVGVIVVSFIVAMSYVI